MVAMTEELEIELRGLVAKYKSEAPALKVLLGEIVQVFNEEESRILDDGSKKYSCELHVFLAAFIELYSNHSEMDFFDRVPD